MRINWKDITVKKTITYRVGAAIITFVLSFFILHRWMESLIFTIVAMSTKTAWYYIHEKMWKKIIKKHKERFTKTDFLIRESVKYQTCSPKEICFL